MMAAILIGMFFLLLMMAVPIGFAMGLATAIAIGMHETLPMTLLVQRSIVGAESYALLAIPFFILAGNLMNGGGLTDQIVRLAMAFVGRFKGGLALTSVLAALIFTGLSGSAAMEPLPALLILIPVLVPVVSAVGIDLVHFGLVMVFNLCIGLITPPVGILLYICAKFANVTLEEESKEIMPFLVASIVVLIIITVFPSTVLWLPALFK